MTLSEAKAAAANENMGFVSEKIGRSFSALSIHPNSEDWLISECSDELETGGGCYILKFNKNTEKLYRYQKTLSAIKLARFLTKPDVAIALT